MTRSALVVSVAVALGVMNACGGTEPAARVPTTFTLSAGDTIRSLGETFKVIVEVKDQNQQVIPGINPTGWQSSNPAIVSTNNAGVISVGPWQTQTHEDFREMLDIQLWGVLNTTLAVLPSMVERGGGRIANVTSVGGKISVPWLLPYSTAKFAAVGFSEGLRAELAGTGVEVTTVVPGLMRTGSFLAAYFKGDRAPLEYSLFTPLSSTPATTVSAARAAGRIVAAIRRGDPEVTLGLHATLAARANGLAPGATAGMLALVARALPEVRGTSRLRGSEIDSPVDRSPLTRPGRRAADELNQ